MNRATSADALEFAAVEERIAAQIIALCKGRKHPKLATNIKLIVSDDLLPPEEPESSLSNAAYLEYLVGSSLSDENVWVCEESLEILIICANKSQRDICELSLTWNKLVPEPPVS